MQLKESEKEATYEKGIHTTFLPTIYERNRLSGEQFWSSFLENVKKNNHEIQPGPKPGSFEFQSDIPD